MSLGNHKKNIGFDLPLFNAKGANNFSPSDLPGLVLWLDASSGVTLVSGKVDVWADKSGNGNNAYASVAAERCNFNAANAGFNNFPTYSPVANQGLRLTNTITLGDFTIVWASKKATTLGNYSCLLGQLSAGANYGGDDVDNLGLPYLKNATGNLCSNGQGNSYPSGGETTKHIAAIRRAGTNVGGSLNADNKAFVSSNSANLTLSSLFLFVPGSGYEYVGDVAQILIYNNSLSDANLSLVKTYINSLISAY